VAFSHPAVSTVGPLETLTPVVGERRSS
jgi:hypothetical protein